MQDEVRNKIKRIRIYTKRLMQSTLTGDYLSAFKGSGLEFDQLREYQIGDDVRFIDWNSSAKMNKIMIKQFIEERDRTIILGIDISNSCNYSSNKELRSETIAHVAAALAFIATNNNDKVGAFFFSDQIEKWIPPSRGNAHYAKILETLFTIKPKSKLTSIEEAIRFLVSLKQRNAIVFMLSDWIDKTDSYSKLLKVARLKYDFIGIRFLDKQEKALPQFGLLDIQDPETNQTITINTNAFGAKKLNLNRFLQSEQYKQKKDFEKQNIDLFDLEVGKPFITQMIQFFHRRIRKQI